MKEKTIVKELTEKRTATNREYLLSDGSHRIVRTLAPAVARSSTVTDGLELENYQIDNTAGVFSATPDPLNKYWLYSTGYGVIALAFRAKLTTTPGNISAVTLRYAVDSATVGNNDLCLYRMDSLEDTLDWNYTYCTDTQYETIDGRKYISVDIFPWLNDAPTADHYFLIHINMNMNEGEEVYLHGVTSNFPPEVVIDLAAPEGVDYRQSYVEGSAGNAGAYRVNTRTGRVDFTKELFALGGERMPMGMSLSYNPYISGGAYATQMPSGWKLNYQQYVYLDGTDYKYIDGNYRRHTFKPLAGTGRYYDTAHTGLLLTVSGSTVTITDDRATTLTFSGGKLTKIEENSGSTATQTSIAYTSSDMTVTDGMGRKATVTFGASAVTITRPDSQAITLTFTDGKLTGITEAANGTNAVEAHAYTYNSEGKLTSAEAGYGGKVVFTYNGAGKVTQIDEKMNSNATLRYALSYSTGNTSVDMTKYPKAGSSTITRNTVYAYAANGDATGTYEHNNNSLAGVRFRSSEDFARYVLYVNPEDSYTGQIFDGSTFSDMYTVTSAGNYALTPEGTPQYKDGEELVYSAQITPDASASSKDFCDITCGFMKFTPSMDIGTPSSRTIYADGGVQTLVIKMPKEEYDAGRNLLLLNVPDGVKFTISNVRVSRRPKNNEIDCVNFGATGALTFTEKTDGIAKTWYEVSECVIGTETVKMTKADWLATLENRARASGDFILWHSDLSGAIKVNSSTQITMKLGANTIAMALGAIEYATVSEKGTRKIFEYNAYGTGDNYVVTTKNTVFADNSNKLCTLRYDNYYRLAEAVDSEGAVTTYTYDTYGNVTQEKITADGKSIVRDSVYGDHSGAATGGKYLIEEKDCLGGLTNVRKYRYDDGTGDISREISPKDLTTSYAYKANGEPESIKATVDNAENAHVFNYDDKGRLNKVDYNGMSYVLTYDDNYNEVTEVTARYNSGTNVDTLMQKEYSHSSKNDIVKTTTGRYEYSERTYDAYGRQVMIDDVSYAGSAQSNIYGAPTDDVANVTSPTDAKLTINADSKLRKRIDNDRSAVYTYDSRGNVTKVARTDGVTVTNDYDKDGRVSSQSVAVSGSDTVTTTFTYENGDALSDDRVTRSVMSFGSLGAVSTNDYDKFGRPTSGYRSVEVGNRPFGVGVTDGYEYAQGSGTGTTTEKPSKVTHVLDYNEGDGGHEVILPTESFGYDANGNIKTITRGDKEVRYTYDKLNRLTREDNALLGKTWTYTYDAGGNVTSKLEYAYTISDEPGAVTKDYGIGYDQIRKDNLKTFNGKSFEYSQYDGFPTTYKGVSLEWYNRRLYAYGGTLFTYDADNVRRTKTRNNKTTTYYYEGSRLLAEKQGNRCVQYLYDHNGITGFSDNGNPYLYGKNALGDITEIYDLFGAKVASYAYDAWGNCTVYTASGAIDDDASSIGNTNPFRYRGYYYDAETKLYYLINRYYDPEVGRFISPDHIGYMMEQMEQLNGCNLYAYCLNNPVMETDPEGTFIGLLVGLLVSAAIGFVSSVVSQGVEYGWDNINFGQAVVDSLFAVASTALAATGIGAITSSIIGAGMGLGQYVVASAFHGEEITLAGALISLGVGALSGRISGRGASNAKTLADGMTGRADAGIRALVTATIRYGKDSVQYAKVNNLYRKAIHQAVQTTINKSFTRSVMLIWGTTVAAPWLQKLLNMFFA